LFRKLAAEMTDKGHEIIDIGRLPNETTKCYGLTRALL
jgi:hypothetical protein